jgi:perosamine synthetase
MSETVPHSRPTLGEAEEAALLRVVRSGQIAQGPEVAALEREAAPLLGHTDGVACGSGSQALLLALTTLGLGASRRVALPAYTCSAVLHAVQWAGAEPVLLDNAPEGIAPGVEELEAAGPLAGVVLVHPWGYPIESSPWREVVRLIIEDCAGSVGASRDGVPVGAMGDAAIISFYATKMLCAGEGGLLAAPDPALLERARDRRDYDGRPEWAMRFNFKLSDLQAAVARAQVARLPSFLERRRRLAARYDREVPGFGLRPVAAGPGMDPSYYRYLCWARGDISELLAHCERHGVHCRRPVPVTLDVLLGTGRRPRVREAFHRLISLPLYPSLTDAEQQRVLEVLAAGPVPGGMV